MKQTLHLSLLAILIGLFSITSVWSVTQGASRPGSTLPGEKKAEKDEKRQQKKARMNKKERRSLMTYHTEREGYAKALLQRR